MHPAWTSRTLADLCRADGEFGLAARFWTGGLRLEIGGAVVGAVVTAGVPAAGEPKRGDQGVITIAAAEPVWAKLLAARPRTSDARQRAGRRASVPTRRCSTPAAAT